MSYTDLFTDYTVPWKREKEGEKITFVGDALTQFLAISIATYCEKMGCYLCGLYAGVSTIHGLLLAKYEFYTPKVRNIDTYHQRIDVKISSTYTGHKSGDKSKIDSVEP